MMLLLGACSPAYVDPSTIADTVDPPAIFAQLSEASSLDKGVAEFAVALNVDPKVVRIRIQPGDCLVCRMQSTPQLSTVEGLTLEEANKLVEAKDQVSLFVPKFSCIFLYDGSNLTPQSCQMSPI